MYQTSCQPSAKEAIFYWCMSFHLLAALLKNLFTHFNGFLHILILLYLFVFIYFVLFWGLFHHWFDAVKVLQMPTLRIKDSPSAKI